MTEQKSYIVHFTVRHVRGRRPKRFYVRPERSLNNSQSATRYSSRETAIGVANMMRERYEAQGYIVTSANVSVLMEQV